jgi:NTP pyrophosphatase (non-canonical NTP hydrolase)
MLRNYQQLAMQTKSPHAGENEKVSPDLIHAVLGLCDESYELLSATPGGANEIEELGDLLWFVALLNESMDWDVDIWLAYKEEKIPMPFTPTPLQCMGAASAIAGLVKKPYAYGDKRDIPFIEVFNKTLLIIAIVEAIAKEQGVTLEEVQEANIAKLHGNRYTGGKFDQTAEVERDNETEIQAVSDSVSNNADNEPERITNLGHLPDSIRHEVTEFVSESIDFAFSYTHEEEEANIAALKEKGNVQTITLMLNGAEFWVSKAVPKA